MTGKESRTELLLPEDDGILAGRVTPESTAYLGSVLAELSGRCMIGYAPDSPFAQATAYSIAGAAAAAGGQIVMVSDCVPVELGAASVAGDCDTVLHIDNPHMHIYAKGLLPLTAAQTDILLHTSSSGWLQRTDYGNIADGEGLRLLYPREILRRLPKSLRCMPEISTASPRMQTLLTRLFRGGRGTLMTFQMASDGRRVSLYTAEHGWIFYERLLLLAARQFFIEGRDVALPYWMPHAAETLAAKYHRRVLRYASASDGTDAEARALALRQGITLDAGVLCAEFLRMYSEQKESLAIWQASLPDSHTVRRIIKTPDSAPMDTQSIARRCADRWSTEQTPEGVVAGDARGHALIRPSATGRSLTLWAEADSMEIAAELAGALTACLERPDNGREAERNR